MSALDIGKAAATTPVDIRDALDAVKRLGANPNPLDLGEPVRQLAVAARALNELDAETVRLAALGILNETCGMVKAFADHFLKQAWREAAGPEKEAKAKEKERQAIFKAAQKMAGRGGIEDLEDPPVAEDPVSGQLLIEEFVTVMRRFLVVPEASIWTMALWALDTYLYDAFEVFPYLALSSPVKRCGKTTTEKLLSAFVRRPLMASSVSPAVIYRVIEHFRPTLLLDEVDALLSSKDDNLRGVLNAGHARSGKVLRCEADSLEPRAFQVFGPKVLALIGTLPTTLADRSITIAMKRKKKGDARERLTRAPYQRIVADGETWRGKALRWAQDHRDDILQAPAPRLPEGLDDRAVDNWEPLFILAQTLGGDWPARVTKAAEILTAGSRDDVQEVSLILLGDLKAVWPPEEELMPTATLLEELHKLEDKPWPSYGRSGKGLSARDLAWLVGQYGIRPMQIRIGSAPQCRGYQASDFADAWGRYLVEKEPPSTFSSSDPSHPLSVNENDKLTAFPHPSQEASVTDQKIDLSPRNNSDATDVTDTNPENGGAVSSPPHAGPETAATLDPDDPKNDLEERHGG